ncbi:DUF1028 domain-containing protein [Rhodobacteraceae bacterium WD3A24]|nr:DUF1028 domain-containing protein [Rhodobacteraceae bacterium WD3A24]
MTFSLLARDPGSGTLCGAAATGSLCVGGWVLRGDARAGLSASQGAAPSTMWGDDALALMRAGVAAGPAVEQLTAPDRGRNWRQLAALDRHGGAGHFTGTSNTAWRGARAEGAMVAAGNLLAGPQVLDALMAGFAEASGAPAERLLAALDAAAAAGGDSRGLQSAALLIVAEDAAPLTLRVDWAESPLDALRGLYARTREPEYRDWAATVPTLRHPELPHDG